MEYAPTIGSMATSIIEYLLRVAPITDLWRIILIVMATFGAVQAFKYVSRLNPDSDGYGPAVLRGLGVVLGPVFAWVFWPVTEVAPILAVGLIGWVGSHLLAKFGLRWLEAKTPTLYRAIEGLPERRGPEGPPPRSNRRK